MDSNICFEMIFFVVEVIRERCARFMILTATVSEICGGQTNVTILVVFMLPTKDNIRALLLPSAILVDKLDTPTTPAGINNDVWISKTFSNNSLTSAHWALF